MTIAINMLRGMDDLRVLMGFNKAVMRTTEFVGAVGNYLTDNGYQFSYTILPVGHKIIEITKEAVFFCELYGIVTNTKKCVEAWSKNDSWKRVGTTLMAVRSVFKTFESLDKLKLIELGAWKAAKCFRSLSYLGLITNGLIVVDGGISLTRSFVEISSGNKTWQNEKWKIAQTALKVTVLSTIIFMTAFSLMASTGWLLVLSTLATSNEVWALGRAINEVTAERIQLAQLA